MQEINDEQVGLCLLLSRDLLTDTTSIQIRDGGLTEIIINDLI